MGMKPPMNEPAIHVKNAVNQQKKRTVVISRAHTSPKARSEGPVKGSIQRKGK